MNAIVTLYRSIEWRRSAPGWYECRCALRAVWQAVVYLAHELAGQEWPAALHKRDPQP